MPRLENGQTFPALQLPVVGGGLLRLPEAFADGFGAFLVYRGSWCPYCNAQLAGFQRAADALHDAGIKVAAASVDDEQTSAALVDKLGLTFPVAHSADADDLAATLGCYVNDDPRYLQSTGFVLAPGGTVLTALYSSGAIGRLRPDDVVGLVGYVKDHS